MSSCLTGRGTEEADQGLQPGQDPLRAWGRGLKDSVAGICPRFQDPSTGTALWVPGQHVSAPSALRPYNQRLLDVSAHTAAPPASSTLPASRGAQGRHQQVQGCAQDPGSVQPVTASNSQQVVKVKDSQAKYTSRKKID